MTTHVGTPMKRKEDPRMITGRGNYTEDINLPGMLHLVVVRSPEAHATITSIDTSAATERSGVVAVLTGEDMAGDFAGPLPMVWAPPGVEIKTPEHWPLKRGEVKHGTDRYANLESAYLLQRLEAFSGIALLTTNLRANIDEAFTRRLDLVVDFPFPDKEQRLALWRHSLAHVPCAADADPSRVAEEFELAGGAIRSAVVTAAYLAAGRGDRVTAADLLQGARREYRKAGRLLPAQGTW